MTRKEAIEELKRDIELDNDFTEDYINAVNMAIKALEQEPYQEWIPVSEKLPTKEEYIANNGLFIVSDGNRNYAEYFDIYDSKKFGEFIVFGFRVDKCVIAWMPLPVEPYKAESEGQG